MTLKEQMGQMFMVGAYSNRESDHTAFLENLIYNYHIGGLIFFQGTPRKQAYLTNYLQSISKLPLMIGMDAEWGLNMRIQPSLKFPYQMTLGSMNKDTLIYQMGREIGLQCRRMGVHINFAPVVDINSNPDNPIIGFRSFGEDRWRVTSKALNYAMGMQDEGVIACAKHFPGHGNTNADSHLDLPFVGGTLEELDSVELLPYKLMIQANVMSVMTGHLEVPALDTTPHMPSSLSKIIVTDLLKRKMGFGGLVITDGLNMEGVARYFKPGYAEYAAFMAGNDILLMPQNVPLAMDLLQQGVDSGWIDSADIASRARKILLHKYWAGADKFKPIKTDNLERDLFAPTAVKLVKKVAETSVCLARNETSLIPISRNTSLKIASVAIGKSRSYFFQEEMRHQHKVDNFQIAPEASFGDYMQLQRNLEQYDVVIVSFHNRNVWGKKALYIGQSIIQLVYGMQDRGQKIVLVPFCNAYLMRNFPNIKHVLLGYEDGHEYQQQAGRAIFGEVPAIGKLPVNIPSGYAMGSGINTSSKIHKHPVLIDPTEVGMDKTELENIDKVLNKMMSSGAAPGAQVMVLKDGKLVYKKAVGYTTWNKAGPVDSTTIYDIASITKVAATTLVVMKLFEEKKIKLDEKLGTYLPEVRNTNKSDLTIKELLTHQAGLEGWIPFYKEALERNLPIFSKTPTICNTIQVADDMYMDSTYLNIIWDEIYSSPLKNRGTYKYSDLSMILMKKVVEKITKEPLELYVQRHFYDPLDLQTTTYLPLKKFSRFTIAPTSDDNEFRKQTVYGYVHDPAAAMFGGVSGHAGVFSNAEDLSVLFQMLLNGGEYNGKRYFKSETVKLFTTSQFQGNRRGLGFDKPAAGKNIGPTSTLCSQETYGHTGFTGTCVWVDPKYDLVYVFLSNRVHPDENNKKLVELNIRTDIQDIIYQAIKVK